MNTSAASPSALHDMLSGAWRFAVVSLAAFGIWAFSGKMGDVLLYSLITVAFLALSGLLMFPLTPGPKRLLRFYAVFIPGFLLYAVLWCVGWFGMAGPVPFARGHFTAGELLGSAAGLAAMVGVFCIGLKIRSSFLPVFAVLYLFHTLGYTLGGVCYYSTHGDGVLASILEGHATAGRLLWGALYGAGFGAGLGYALHVARTKM